MQSYLYDSPKVKVALLTKPTPLYKTQEDPFPRFSHPSSNRRDWAWQPMNAFADDWYHCFVRLSDALKLRSKLQTAVGAHERYRCGLSVCTEVDLLAEFVIDFTKRLTKQKVVTKDVLKPLAAVADRLNPKLAAPRYVKRVRNKAASHVEVPEREKHQDRLTWNEARELYDGVFQTQLIDHVINTLSRYIADAAPLPIYEWLRIVDREHIQIWVPLDASEVDTREHSMSIQLFSPETMDRLADRATLTLAQAFPSSDCLVMHLVGSEIQMLPCSSSPQTSAHSIRHLWRIENLP